MGSGKNRGLRTGEWEFKKKIVGLKEERRCRIRCMHKMNIDRSCWSEMKGMTVIGFIYASTAPKLVMLSGAHLLPDEARSHNAVGI